jgi:hypothetical protein
MVSLIERDHANVSFCSNHVLGAALPPSFGGWPSAKQPRDLRLCVLAPCALAPPTRRSRGNLRSPWGASSRQGAPPLPAAFRGVQFVPILTSFARSALMPRLTSAGIVVRKPSTLAPAYPRAASARRSVFAAVSLRSRWPPSSPSSPPLRCPGSGLQRSPQLLASKPLRPPRRSRGTTASPHPAGGGDPASAATANC